MLHSIIFEALEQVGAELINPGRPGLATSAAPVPAVLDSTETGKISSSEMIITVENIKNKCDSNSYVFYYTKKFAITKLSLNI